MARMGSVDSERSRRVVFHRFGGPEVLDIEWRSVPAPAAGEVLVRVAAAGVNPVDWKLFSGKPMHDPYERSLPSGNGYDFAGRIEAVGTGVDPQWKVGDRVFGGLRYQAQADHLLIDPARLARVPTGLGLDVAGALNVVGRTAWATVESQRIMTGDTVLVSGAAGGVGILTAQLCLLRGARVLGTAGPGNHALLRRLGIEPIPYGQGLLDRIRAEADQVSVVLDTVGHGTVRAAIDLGVPAHRINTIADYPAREEYRVGGVGGASAGVAELTEVAKLIADGKLTLPIAARYALEDVRSAYTQSISGHVTGKIVIETGQRPCEQIDARSPSSSR